MSDGEEAGTHCVTLRDVPSLPTERERKFVTKLKRDVNDVPRGIHWLPLPCAGFKLLGILLDLTCPLLLQICYYIRSHSYPMRQRQTDKIE